MLEPDMNYALAMQLAVHRPLLQMISFIIYLTGLPQFPGNRQPAVGDTAASVLFGMTMGANGFVIGACDRGLGAVDQGHAPFLAEIAPLFITRTAEHDAFVFAASFRDGAGARQGLSTAGVREALTVISELDQLAWADQFSHARQRSEGSIVGMLTVEALQLAELVNLARSVSSSRRANN
jgi:hypothetical protein